MRTLETKSIPDELKQLKQWVLWKYEKRNGKVTKVPYQVNGKHAASDDPTTWATYNDALSCIAKYEGLGIVFANGLAGIDLDHHHNGNGPDEFATSIISRLNSYTELSPSGEGIHILFYGSLPPDGRKKQELGVEMYDSGRFFTVTGWHLDDTPPTVEERTFEAGELHREIFGASKPATEPRPTEPNNVDDAALIEIASHAKNGDKFTQLWTGDISGHPSASEADLALCNYLAFWAGGEVARIDRLFRSSGLMRPKWDERHNSNGATYGAMTIDQAIRGATEFYIPGNRIDYDLPESPPNFPEESVSISGPTAEFIDPWQPRTLATAYMPRPPAQYVIDGLFRIPSVNIVYGPPGTLKTFVLADLAINVAAGLDFLPPAPWQPGALSFKVTQYPVIWIDFDNGSDLTDERFAALGRARKLTPNIPLTYYSMPSPWLNAADKKSIGALVMRAKALQAKVIFIDNLGDVTGSVDENTADMGNVMSLFRQLAEEARAAVVIIHHQRKGNGTTGRAGDSLRGHSSIEAALDLALLIEREEGSDTITLKATKTRGKDVLPFAAVFTYEADNNGELLLAKFYGLTAEDNTSGAAMEREIKAALHGTELNTTDLVKAVKERMPNTGIHRIRERIERMAAIDLLKTRAGVRNEKFYSLP